MSDALACPKCATSLESKTLETIPVDQCPTCQGIWFDEEELQAVLTRSHDFRRELHRSAGESSLNQKRGRCPRDKSQMLRAFSATGERVVLDMCPDCHGLWLDGGELDRLIKAMNR
jgi:uncharacterized protein